MKLLNKMERKYGRYAIKNLSLYIIGCYVLGYIISQFMPGIMNYLTLEPAYVLQGQVWRVVSWVLIPPESLDIFTFIMLILYYTLGTALERSWGSFRYNVYIFTGLIASVIGAFFLYVLGVFPIGYAFSTYYVNLSIFLAFATYYPEEKVYLYFVLPIKMKWMGIFYGIIQFFFFIQSGWVQRVVIIASLVNFLIFFFLNQKTRGITPKEIQRKRQYQKKVQSIQKIPGITKHKCAICGRTELDGDDLEFRFCSKCDGNYEYCQEHLFTHEHVHK